MTAADGSILITGVRGMLGTDLRRVLAEAGLQVRGCDLPDVDITDTAALAAQLSGCGAVVNCAAYTDVDGAEGEPGIADAVNRAAVRELGRLGRERGLYVLHVSTDFVFDGMLERPYRETDRPNPLNVYGRTKLAGERELASSGCRHAIVRVEWTYGCAGRNFVSKFLQRAGRGDDLTMVTDQTGSPTWTRDVSAALLALLRRHAEGLYHYAARGYATRFEVARALLEEAGLPGKRLAPCRTADFPAAARRPLNSRFDCTKIDGCLDRPRPVWRESLAAFMRTAYAP